MEKWEFFKARTLSLFSVTDWKCPSLGIFSLQNRINFKVNLTTESGFSFKKFLYSANFVIRKIPFKYSITQKFSNETFQVNLLLWRKRKSFLNMKMWLENFCTENFPFRPMMRKKRKSNDARKKNFPFFQEKALNFSSHNQCLPLIAPQPSTWNLINFSEQIACHVSLIKVSEWMQLLLGGIGGSKIAIWIFRYFCQACRFPSSWICHKVDSMNKIGWGGMEMKIHKYFTHI